jgi:hypothetical protein
MVMTTLHVVANAIQYAQDQPTIHLSKVLLFVKVSTMYSRGAWTCGRNLFVHHPKQSLV